MYEDEEDIIFEGSPLAQHLQNVGVEFEAVSRDKDRTREDVQGVRENADDHIRIWEAENSTIVDMYYRKQSMEVILTSGLLIHEDCSLLKDFMTEVNDRSFASNLKSTLKRGTVDALVLGIAAVPWRSVLPTLHTALCFGLSAFVAWRWRGIWTAFTQTRKLKSFLEVTKKVDDSIKKAVCMIGDCSLISRGYLLLQRNDAVWRMEKPNLLEVSKRSQANLPGLRKALLAACKRLSVELAAATHQLRRQYPLPLNLDDRDLYFPELELDSPSESSDSDSIPTVEELRSAANKHILLRSEYLRRLFLHLLFIEVSPMDIVWSSNLQDKMTSCLKSIECAIAVYKPFFSNLTRPSERSPARQKSFLDELVISTHSTSIHIQEALLTSQELENIVSKCKDLPELDLKELDELSHKIKYHLQCAGLCIERSVIVSGKGASKNDPPPAPAISEPSTKSQEEIAEIPIEGRVDIAQFDEIFELYNKGGREVSSREMEEEETHKPMEKKGQFMVLQELKNVLAVKAADWKEREKVARRQRLGDLADLGGLESDPEEDDDGKEESGPSLKCEERKKSVEEQMMEAVFDDSSIQNMCRGDGSSSFTPVINEPFQAMGTSMVGSLAAEAVAKAKAQISFGLMSDVQSFGSSDSEESVTD